ncbi:RHS repeat-associated core domain-containing protein [Streptomyces sp. NPDC058469]|uniref:RHS repeat-associated core domain-containing protein n=1 Tax=Streptomyces sp. NPDC058469 TaxID=3346514 RepID=UPI0036631A39
MSTTTATAYTYDEFGNTTNSPRYGWLGSMQRASDTPDRVVLMGVRLFDAVTGRFLQTDPIPDGSANAYEYAGQDPVNNMDLDGRRIKERVVRQCTKYDCVTLKRMCDSSRHMKCSLSGTSPSGAGGEVRESPPGGNGTSTTGESNSAEAATTTQSGATTDSMPTGTEMMATPPTSAGTSAATE